MAIYTRINAIAFDIGGVLTEIDKTPLRFLQNCDGLKSEDFFDEEFIHLQRGLIDPEQFFLSKCKKTGIAFEKLREAFVKMIPGETSAPLLERLTVPYFFASNINQLHFEIVMEKIRPTPFCRRHSILSYRVGHQKPSNNFFDFLELRNLAPNTVLFIDDKRENLEAANRHGLVAIQCLGPKNLPRLLSTIFSNSHNFRRRPSYTVERSVSADRTADAY